MPVLKVKTLKETRRENDVALNYYAISYGKGPRFDVEPTPPATPARDRKPQPGPEAGVLSAVLKALAIHPAVAWVRRMNTGAVKVGSGPSARFVRFGFTGCSDILGQMKDGRLLAVECKSDKGKLSEAQVNFIDTVRAAGGVAGMARSIDDALLIIKYGLMSGPTVKAGQGECNSRGFPPVAHTPSPLTSPDSTLDPTCETVTRKP
jgi:hypothetical protein